VWELDEIYDESAGTDIRRRGEGKNRRSKENEKSKEGMNRGTRACTIGMASGYFLHGIGVLF